MAFDNDPTAWRLPPECMHPDLNAADELEHLRRFATALLALRPACRVSLDVPEPALMHVTVYQGERVLGEVYAAADPRSEAWTFSVYTAVDTPEEKAYHSDNAAKAAAWFAARAAS